MPCALCHQPKVLKNSHIIPEFLYSSIYDEIHRFHVLSVLPDQNNSIEQKGLREFLLCGDCEQKLSVWERYASLVLAGGIELTYRREGNIVHISGLNYEQFRLFQLSVIWRAGLSTLQFFENVQLFHHLEVLRKLLIAGNPGIPNRYGCLMFGIKFENKAFTQIIMQPGKIKLLGHTAYRFIFGGFMWVFFVSAHNLHPPYSDALLRPDGRAVFLIKDVMEMENLAGFSRDLVQMGRVP